MPNISAKDILQQAQKGKYAIGSFNFSTHEILKAIISTANTLQAPIIVSTSEGEADFLGMEQAVALIEARRQRVDLPILLNLDHGKSLTKIKQAIEAGYDMVHFDGSELPYKENIARTKEVAEYAKDKNIIIEGELGYLRGSSTVHEELLEIKKEDLTSPEQAKDFIEKTGVDSLAVVIGNAHGVFVSSPEKLYLDRLAEIKEAVGDKVFLVLHGGSGVPDNDIKKAIKLGIVKINVNTDIRVAWTKALQETLGEQPKETTPYKILEPSFEAVKKVVEGKIRLFGSRA